MQKIPSSRIDMYEYLPVPFGLVRYGVAPDHPEVKVWVARSLSHIYQRTSADFCRKNVQEKFEEVASSDRFEFIGNIAVGKDISLTKLAPHYDAILFAHGAVEDRRLDLPGEDLNGVYSARAFVGWYNGLPQYAGLSLVLDGEEAVVIGQGNVALDVARVLLTDVGVLRKTDMAEHAIDALAKSRVKRVSVVGRRGPMQVCGHADAEQGHSANLLRPGSFHNKRASRAYDFTNGVVRSYPGVTHALFDANSITPKTT